MSVSLRGTHSPRSETALYAAKNVRRASAHPLSQENNSV